VRSDVKIALVVAILSILVGGGLGLALTSGGGGPAEDTATGPVLVSESSTSTLSPGRPLTASTVAPDQRATTTTAGGGEQGEGDPPTTASLPAPGEQSATAPPAQSAPSQSAPSNPPTTSSLGRPSATPPPPPSTSSPSGGQGILGRVTDMDTGQPIAGATVRLGNRSAQTAADGSFRIEGSVAAGERLTADKDGFIGTERLVESPTSGRFLEYDLSLLNESSPNAPPPPPSL
jgi:hypothetical protein